MNLPVCPFATDKERYEILSDLIVELRDQITRLDPEYADEWLGELVHSPEICVERIILWMKSKETL